MSTPPHIPDDDLATVAASLRVAFQVLAKQQEQINALAEVIIGRDPAGYRMKAGGAWEAFDTAKVEAVRAEEDLPRAR